jgi:hypothetical protein
MIRVDRGKVVPIALDGPRCRGVKEFVRALRHFGAALPPDKKFTFSAYKDESVVAALRKLFGRKCAYCESPYAPTQKMDVEHFRPKGAVVGYDVRRKRWLPQRPPGYFWLAASWENLLPSCSDCNREREQEFDDGTTGLAGKLCKFPLISERRRGRLSAAVLKKAVRLLGAGVKFDATAAAAARAVIDKAWTLLLPKEEVLLLNPCDDDPDEHLEFLDDGIVRPALERNSKPSLKGELSIEVYALSRKDLVDSRHDHAKMVQAQLERVYELVEQIYGQPRNTLLKRRWVKEMEALQSYEDAGQQYTGMARQIIRRYEKLYGALPT